MVIKKYLIFTGLAAALAAQPAMAQESESATSASWSGRDMTYRGGNYDVLDSSYYSGKKLEQFGKYQNHQTIFPPKPNNMWEIGINAGAYNVIGDIPSRTFFNAMKGATPFGFGATIRKALGYTFSLRAQYVFGRANGLDWQPGLGQNLQYSATQTLGSGDAYYNYKTTSHEIDLELVAAINNIRFHKAKNSMSIYGFAGPGYLNYKTYQIVRGVGSKMKPGNAAVANTPNAVMDVDLINKEMDRLGVNRGEKKDVYDHLIDNVFEDNWKDQGTVRDRSDIVATAGAGIQFKLGKRVSLQLEDKITIPFSDNIDGIFKQARAAGVLTPDKDLINYASLGINFNIGNARKNVLPLWWVNPLDHAYGELSDPRHMRLPDPILADDDNDGISNQFDKCPGTPAGVAVDSHGCPMDTDGDGVPDYKDKQMITPTECQPVDADGVGKCPCPDGCGGSGVACGSIMSGSLNFTGNSSRISAGNQSQLNNLAAQMSANPTCKVVITGGGNASKVQQQRSWDRVNAVIEYMSEKSGIDRGRFIFQYGGTGDENSVMYRSANAGEEGPGNVPPPFPNLRRN